MATTTPVIETTGLTKHFGNVTAVQGLDLTVNDGEIYGFLGPNGAGKTTTINMLLSLVRPTSGSVRLFGETIGPSDEHVYALHDRIGVLPAHMELYSRLTARKHLEFVIRVKDATDDPAALLDRVGIPDAIDRSAGEFSTGMAQRLKLAMALVGDPDLLLLDEPTNGLDPNGAREIREIITAENNRGTTVFFSSHRMDQVEAVCDRVGILRDGTLVAEDTITGLREQVGSAATLSVTVDTQPGDILDRLRNLPDVQDVELKDTTLTISLTDADAKSEVLNTISAAGFSIEDFSLSEQSLEDLFASYTTDANKEVTA